jgi:hypothetical protein
MIDPYVDLLRKAGRDTFWTFRMLLRDFDPSAVEEWIHTQAQLFSKFDEYYSPPAPPDFILIERATEYLAFLLSEELLKDCNQQIPCGMTSLRQEYMEYLSSLTISQFVKFKSYLLWVDRTQQTTDTNDQTDSNDYHLAQVYLYNKMVRCNCCRNTDFPTNYLESFIATGERLTEFWHQMKSAIDEVLSTKHPSVSTLKKLLFYVHQAPEIVTISDFLIIRYMVSILYLNYQERILKSSQNDTFEDIVDMQAYIGWFIKLCPDQSIDKQMDDLCNGKRYVAFLIADGLFRKCRESHCCPLDALGANKAVIRLLQSLSIEEFIRYKAYLIWHDRNMIRNDNTKDSNTDYFIVLGDLIEMMRGCLYHQRTRTANHLRRVIECADLPNTSEIKSAKLFRIRNLPGGRSDALEVHLDGFYSSIRTILNVNTPNNNPVIPVYPIGLNPYIVNMFEYFLGGVTCP